MHILYRIWQHRCLKRSFQTCMVYGIKRKPQLSQIRKYIKSEHNFPENWHHNENYSMNTIKYHDTKKMESKHTDTRHKLAIGGLPHFLTNLLT